MSEYSFYDVHVVYAESFTLENMFPLHPVMVSSVPSSRLIRTPNTPC